MTNGFALNHGKSLQIYFFCLKRRAKNNFLKDVESTVIKTHFRKRSAVDLMQELFNDAYVIFFYMIFFIKAFVVITYLNILDKSLKTYVVGTQLNCLDLSRQFK